MIYQQALFDLTEAVRITQEVALWNADSINELRLKFKLHSKSYSVKDTVSRIDHLSLHEDEPEEGEEPISPALATPAARPAA